jgi:hypothetical protein
MYEILFGSRWRLLVLLILFAISAQAQNAINAWTNGSGGNWQDLRWSLGMRPGAEQSIFLTNRGRKVVTIDPITSHNFSQTMQVSQLTLFATRDSFNLLFLNSAGLQTPFVAGELNIGTNSGVTVLQSLMTISPDAGSTGAISIDGTFSQAQSAVVNAGTINLGILASGFYNLTNGVLNVSGDVTIAGNGTFDQFDGTQTNGGINLIGFDPRTTGRGIASFNLSGGVVSATFINVDFGTFNQTGGTNLVAGNLILSSAGHLSSFNLTEGVLSDLNTTIVSNTGVFLQSGGRHVIRNLLKISGADNFSGYALDNGELIARTIQLDTGARFHHNGGTVSNPGLLVLAGQNSAWDEQTASQQFGQLLLGNDVSTLSLPLGVCELRFANSSGVEWSSQATLMIEHWRGSRFGGGSDQIFFGTNANGLTSHQLGQIQFHNPAGTAGMFPATILSTGEVVPASILLAQRSTNALVLQWGNGATLQSATNLFGPYENLVGVSSPYTVQFKGLQSFFRLRN